MKIKFQIVLKKVVNPKHYLLSKLYPLVQAEASSLGDYDLETVKTWISIDYFTAYDAVPNRKLLGFTIDIPDELGEQGRKLIDTPVQSLNPDTSCFAIDLQNDNEIVETVLRYEDDFILQDLQRYQPEIFGIEMKLREVLNYLLAYNLSSNEMDDFLKEFEGSELANKDMQKDKAAQRKRFNAYFENELFHIVFTKYNVIHGEKQKKLKAEEVLQKIQQVNTFEELKQSFYNITFSEIEPNHATFLNTIQRHLLPIETMRNEIMHTRKPSVENEQKYEQAKRDLSEAITQFWDDERSKRPDIETIKSYLMDTVINKSTFEYGADDTVKFRDLNFQEQKMWVEGFKVLIFEQVSEMLKTDYDYEFTAEEETTFYEQMDERILQIV